MSHHYTIRNIGPSPSVKTVPFDIYFPVTNMTSNVTILGKTCNSRPIGIAKNYPNNEMGDIRPCINTKCSYFSCKVPIGLGKGENIKITITMQFLVREVEENNDNIDNFTVFTYLKMGKSKYNVST